MRSYAPALIRNHLPATLMKYNMKFQNRRVTSSSGSDHPIQFFVSQSNTAFVHGPKGFRGLATGYTNYTKPLNVAVDFKNKY